MIYYAILLPHLGYKPGSQLHYLMNGYFGQIRRMVGFRGVIQDYPNDCSYALFTRKGDAMQAFNRYCDRHFEEVRYKGEMDVDEKKIRKV